MGHLRNEVVLEFLQDGNISDIEELHDEDMWRLILYLLSQDMLNEENYNSVPNEPYLDVEEPATTRRQPLLHQTQSSDEGVTENSSNRQSGLWRQSSFILSQEITKLFGLHLKMACLSITSFTYVLASVH